MAEKLIAKNLEIVYKEEGKNSKAVKNINFKVQENEFICLLGPTGCGKTPILNAIAGFIKPTKGEILLRGKRITEPTKEVGIVFQHNILFPWQTVKGNISIGPRINNIPKSQISWEIKKEIKNNIGGFRTYKLTTEADYIELKRKIIDCLN